MARTDFVKEIGTGLVFVGLVDKKQHPFRVEDTSEGRVFHAQLVGIIGTPRRIVR